MNNKMRYVMHVHTMHMCYFILFREENDFSNASVKTQITQILFLYYEI